MGSKCCQVYVAKMFLFPSVVDVFARIAQKFQNPNLQCRYSHQDNGGECEIVSEELSDYLF